jgi:hypothetical protein
VADELVTHGRSQGQKWDGLIALDMVGTGSQWRTVAAFLERDLKRPNRRGGDPPELVSACVYILRGIPPDEVAAFAAMLRRRRPKWLSEEYHWVERCWPALLSEDAGDDWDHEALADWQAERNARYT